MTKQEMINKLLEDIDLTLMEEASVRSKLRSIVRKLRDIIYAPPN